MSKVITAAAAVLLLAISGSACQSSPVEKILLAGPSKAAAAAVADPGRPAEDVARDANRKPIDVLTFSGLKPGDKVAELIPGGGYYTRLIAKVVGPTGKVYAMIPDGLAKLRPQMVDAVKSIPNVEVVVYPGAAPATPEKVDLVWTSENYHDFHNAPQGAPPADIAGFNKAIAAMLKPKGAYLIEDHAAAAGAGTSVTGTLHRIEPAAVISEVTAAGFKLEAQSGVLKNETDPHTVPVFDASVRGKTDKMLFKFRKVGS